MHVVSKGIYYDTSTKGKIGHHHHSYRAEVVVNGIRRRARFLSYSAAVRWKKMMRSQDDGAFELLRAEWAAKREEREKQRKQRLIEREKQRLDALADRMVREIGTPWEKVCRRAAFQPLSERFDEIQRRRIEAVLNVHIDSRWQYAKLWTPQERRIAMEIDRARRSAWAGGVQ